MLTIGLGIHIFSDSLLSLNFDSISYKKNSISNDYSFIDSDSDSKPLHRVLLEIKWDPSLNISIRPIRPILALQTMKKLIELRTQKTQLWSRTQCIYIKLTLMKNFNKKLCKRSVSKICIHQKNKISRIADY